MWLFPFSLVPSVEITSCNQIVLKVMCLCCGANETTMIHIMWRIKTSAFYSSVQIFPNASNKNSVAPTAECSWLSKGKFSVFGSGWNTSGGEMAVWSCCLFSQSSCFELSLWHIWSRVLPLSLCLPPCLSERPCRICMVIEVITASSFYLRLISPRCFIPWVEAARNHFEDKLQQLTTPVQCSFSPPFFNLCNPPGIFACICPG